MWIFLDFIGYTDKMVAHLTGFYLGTILPYSVFVCTNVNKCVSASCIQHRVYHNFTEQLLGNVM